MRPLFTRSVIKENANVKTSVTMVSQAPGSHYKSISDNHIAQYCCRFSIPRPAARHGTRLFARRARQRHSQHQRLLAILKVTGGLDSKIVGKQLRMTAFMKNQDRGRQRDHAERRMIVATERFMNAKTADEKERARKWAHAWQALSRKLK